MQFGNWGHLYMRSRGWGRRTSDFIFGSKTLAVQRRIAQHDFGIFHRFLETAQAAGHPVKGEKVLDIGCGWRFPVTLQLHSYGARVTGIDSEFVGRRLSASHLWSQLVRHGVRVFARSLVREAIYKSVYYRALEKELGAPLRFEGLDLRQTFIETFPGDAEYDLVFSNATFEHLRDVEKAVQIVARVLKPGGMAYISVHLFPSLTGGHEVFTNPGGASLVFGPGVLPWQHLRDPKWREPVGLNRWRERQYRLTFEKHLKIRDWRPEFWEPECYLTEEILKSLPEHSREELLKRSVIAILER